jgi:AcrR family transcriptional regulator
MTRRRPPGPEAKTDGRLNRSIVTRKRIVDALTALIYEGHLTPTAEQVATRADVGLRTVFRHFDDMDALYREIALDLDTVIQPVIGQRLAGATWQDRLRHGVLLRTEFFDRVAALHLATQVHRHESAYLAQQVKQTVDLQRELLRRQLPAEVAQDATLFEALDVVLSIEVWIRLRREQGLSADAARQVMLRTVAGLLSSASSG